VLYVKYHKMQGLLIRPCKQIIFPKGHHRESCVR